MVVTKDSYHPTNVKLCVSNIGPQPACNYHCIYCNYCNKVLLPKLIEKHQKSLSDEPDLSNLISQWDVEVVGCFLPLKDDINAGPSAGEFISRPTTHPTTCHKWTITELDSFKLMQKKVQEICSNKEKKWF